MDSSVLQNLKDWRQLVADAEGCSAVGIISDIVLEEITVSKPKDIGSLFKIKGISNEQCFLFGDAILLIINSVSDKSDYKVPNDADSKENDAPLSVSRYLDYLNNQLDGPPVRVQGEISSFNKSGKGIFFSLKDARDDSVLNCIIWKNVYELSGIEFKIGMEIIASGSSEIYKTRGNLSFVTRSVEMVGEGALKIAYDKLKAKLQKEGIFDEAKKRPLPLYPVKIGLITSKGGAVISDFMANIGRFGYRISFIDSRVEGQLATEELLNSIRTFRKKDIDVLVIIRGGGSMESFLPFNNEMLVREIANFPVPVVAGIGHEKDVSLLAMASDLMVSTPTAVANALNESWEQAESKVKISEQKLFGIFNETLHNQTANIRDSLDTIKNAFQKIFSDFSKAEESLKIGFKSIKDQMVDIKRRLVGVFGPVFRKFDHSIMRTRTDLTNTLQKKIFVAFNTVKNGNDSLLVSYEKTLTMNDPKRQLKLGYSIARVNGSILKSTGQIKKGNTVTVGLHQGIFESEVTIIKEDNQ